MAGHKEDKLSKRKQSQRLQTIQASHAIFIIIFFLAGVAAIFNYIYHISFFPSLNIYAPTDNRTSASGQATDSRNEMSVASPISATSSTIEPTNSLDREIIRRPRIAYAISITKDGSFQDGAAVLAYSIIANTPVNSSYDISFVAFVHPNVSVSRPYLRNLGFHVIEVPTPINTSAIKFDFLREKIDKNGCCGATELIKLNSYRLTQYTKVIHLDADTIIVNPLEDIFSFPQSLLYTTDPNMATFKKPDCMPVQGGFIVFTPSEQDYLNVMNIMLTTEFRKGRGWNSSHIGWFWGGMTVQGVLPYYYNRVTEPGRSKVLDRCYYNTMADTDECQVQTIDQIKSAHFTVCQKPWSCYRAFINDLCGALHKKWFALRRQAEAFYGLQPTEKPCPAGHGSYMHMKLHDARLPKDVKFVVPDDSPDFLAPIGNTGYIGTRYH